MTSESTTSHDGTSRPPSPWTAPWVVVPETVRELWSLIGNAAFDLGENTRVAWRGLPSRDYQMISSLARELQQDGRAVTEDNLREREQEILRKAREWGVGLSDTGKVSDLHLLAMLQHHGAPTRLIDITFNPLTALWFACADAKNMDEPGVLVVLTVTDTPRLTTTEPTSLTWDTIDTPESASLITALNRSDESGQPFIVEPRPQDTRMKAQEGAFISAHWPESQSTGPVAGLPYSSLAGTLPMVIRGVNQQTMKTEEGAAWSGLAFAGIVLSPALKASLLPILDHTFNRSHRTMYPDLPGFVQEYKARYSVETNALDTADSNAQGT